MIEKGVSHIAYFRFDGGSSKLYTQECVDEKDKEIERLNNIINELEKWLIIQHDIYKNVDKEENTRLSCQYLKVKEKLQELKGVDKE